MRTKATGTFNAHGDFFLRAPYNRLLIQRLKLRIPTKHRSYRAETETWTILAPHGITASAILQAVFPDAEITSTGKETIDRTPPEKAPIDYGAAFLESVNPVLHRDNRRCVYCGAPAAHADQWQAGIPSPNTMVASCLACSVTGRDKHFPSIDEKRAWLHDEQEQHIIQVKARDVPKREVGSGRYRSEMGIYASRRH